MEPLVSGVISLKIALIVEDYGDKDKFYSLYKDAHSRLSKANMAT